MPTTTVIFDYGCVISLAPTPDDYEPLRQVLGVERAAFQGLYWRNREAYDIDNMDTSAYWQDLGRAAGVEFPPAKVQTLADLDIQLWGRTNPVMLEWVRVLRERGLKTAILSNMSRGVGDYFRRTASWLGLFDYLCFSGELKTGKPGPAIYRACLKGVAEPAAHTLFIDDREVNIAAGRALGMPGIVFHSVEQLQNDLQPYGLAESLEEALACGR